MATAAPACPSCGATSALPIVYGLPSFDDVERLDGTVVFAGCCLPDVLHAWSCQACGTSYGEQVLGEDVT